MPVSTSDFLQQLQSAFENKKLIKLTLGHKRNKAADLDNVFARIIEVKNGYKLSFVYRYKTKDITKNFDGAESLKEVHHLLETSFFNADLFTSSYNFYFTNDKDGKAKLVTKPATQTANSNFSHDKQKERIIQADNNIYLKELGVISAEGLVKKDMQDKYRQINKYVEIIEGIIKELDLKDDFTVADMGSGKGYLTFALYDYLHNTLQKKASVTGIEIRKDLVDKCNAIAAKANFDQLHFEEGTIEGANISKIDMLIALHACDTATDDAIYKGITANAQVIICVPCCHKQIRKQMAPDNALQSITKHGILLERQAEMVTDAIRALVLEAFGYKTKVFEFISTEHTPKNVLITAVKRTTGADEKEKNIEKIKALKAMFNIQQHYLEKLMNI